MKIIQRHTVLFYLAFFACGFLLCGFLLYREESPAQRITGKWKEISWVYEKVNHTENGLPDKEITDELRSEMARGLIIHEAETWEFRPDGTLLLHKRSGKPIKLNWNLKGRGHVLTLHYRNDKTEYYDLSDLSADEMTLYIDVEIQAKGIVRMTFEKIA
jgi:hypothetical protein